MATEFCDAMLNFTIKKTSTDSKRTKIEESFSFYSSNAMPMATWLEHLGTMIKYH